MLSPSVAIRNIAQLTSEFSTPQISVSTTSHTAGGVNYVMVRLDHASTQQRQQRQHVGIALDYSNSMKTLTSSGASKRDVMVDALKVALEQMNDDNIVTVVAYGSSSSVVVQNARVGNPDTIPSVLTRLKSQAFMGRTNPSAALTQLQECDQTLLLSDGQFNEGPSSPQVLHSIVDHPILCGSIYPGANMSALATFSEGTSFNIDCENTANMRSLLASSLSAPLIKASGVSVRQNGTNYDLPSVREGCSTQYVLQVYGTNTLDVRYSNENAVAVEIMHTFYMSGNCNPDVQHALTLQKAAEAGLEASITGDDALARTSIGMFKSVGVHVADKNDMLRVSSSQSSQFSVDPESSHCPSTCRASSQACTLMQPHP